MAFLFNAETAQDEMLIREMVERTLEALRGFPADGEVAMIGLDIGSAMVIATLIDIGVAPDCAPITQEMRLRVHNYGSVRLQMTREFAVDLAQFIEIGLARHEAGCRTPEDFTLH